MFLMQTWLAFVACFYQPLDLDHVLTPSVIFTAEEKFQLRGYVEINRECQCCNIAHELTFILKTGDTKISPVKAIYITHD